MNNSDLEKLLKEIQTVFPTIVNVKHEEGNGVVLIDLTDFSPKKEEKVVQFKACIFHEAPPANPVADFYMIDRVSRIEVFHVPIRLEADDPAAHQYASHYSEIARHHVKVQVNPFIPDEGDVFMLIFRAVIMIGESSESIRKELLLAIKDLLAVHYIQGLNSATSNLAKTGLDEESREKISSKYLATIGILLADKTTPKTEEESEF